MLRARLKLVFEDIPELPRPKKPEFGDIWESPTGVQYLCISEGEPMFVSTDYLEAQCMSDLEIDVGSLRFVCNGTITVYPRDFDR